MPAAGIPASGGGHCPTKLTSSGLAISRRLAELLGGSLSVESEVGVGSTSILALPVAWSARPAAERDEDEDPG